MPTYQITLLRRKTVGDATSVTDANTGYESTDGLHELSDIGHNFDPSTGTGKHKHVVFDSDGAYDIGDGTNRARIVYADTLGDSAQTLNVASPSFTLPDDFWLGFGAAAGRLVFDSTPATDTLTVADADLVLSNALYLASGQKISWDSDDVTITHGANALTFAGGAYTFNGTHANALVVGGAAYPLSSSPTMSGGNPIWFYVTPTLGGTSNVGLQMTVTMAPTGASNDYVVQLLPANTLDNAGSSTGLYVRHSVASGKTVAMTYNITLAAPVVSGTLTGHRALNIEDQGSYYAIYVAGGPNYFGTGASSFAGNVTVQKADAGLILDATTGEPGLTWTENGTWRYKVTYDPSNNYWRLASTDSDGGGTDADVIRIPDGQLTVDGNATFDDTAFDFVCAVCGWHSVHETAVCPACGGPVEWHDDAALMLQVRQPLTRRAALERLERIGVVNTYGTLGTDHEQTYICLQPAHQFTWDALGQLYRDLRGLRAEVASLKAAA